MDTSPKDTEVYDPASEDERLSHEAVGQFLQLQKKELEIQKKELEFKDKELELAYQQDNNQKELSEKSIAANLQDRSGERDYRSRKTKTVLVYATIIFLIIAIFSGYALAMGKESVVLKLAEIVALFSAGFVGGYGFRSAKVAANNTKD